LLINSRPFIGAKQQLNRQNLAIDNGCTMENIYAAILGYLLGSIPFGLVLVKVFRKDDLRQIGSGNIGATNVLRTGSKFLAALTLLLDFSKGFFAILIAQGYFDGPAVTFAAGGAVLGHCFPIWLKFRGGKGVATNAGITLGLVPQIGLIYIFVWLSVLAVFRISSVAGMSAVLVASAAAPILGYSELFPILMAIAILVIYLHRENISRIRSGNEPKIGLIKD
jgi:glycerol-3-phosphate acyltransferase PlsY